MRASTQPRDSSSSGCRHCGFALQETPAVHFYSGKGASRSPSTVRSTLANVSRWIDRASSSASGSVTRWNMAHRARYSSRRSALDCLATLASICMSAMFCACKVLSRSMSSSLSMGEFLRRSRNYGYVISGGGKT